MVVMETALAALREHFGFEDFREGQREVIGAILEGHDTVVVMPTGGGKSLCYQLPAMIRDGTTLVISPLIALMKDQVDALHARGLPATFINSSIDFEEQKARLARIRQGGYKLVYVAPERFRSAHFVESLERVQISLFAVDEAHCISTWGHDFRPDYLRLKAFIEQIGRPQIVALTATATPYVRADIIEQLSLREPRAFVSGFDRPNLSLGVVHTQKEREKIARTKALAAAYPGGSGIIYTSTRKSVEKVMARLREAGLQVVAYHAGMDDAERVRAQDDFMSGRVQMIVATNAFGMGIDKPDIRFVAHYHLPGSIEAYYQEIGRAGRDGLASTCVLLFNYADKRMQDYFIEGSYPPPELIARVYEALAAIGQKRTELSTSEIAARAGTRNEMAVQSSLIILEKAGHIERGAASENRAAVRLRVAPQAAREMINSRRGTLARQVLFSLLGGYEVNQRADTEVDLTELAETIGLELPALRRALASLSESGVITYQPARRTRGLLMLDERPARNLRISPQDLARRAALEQRKLREVISFCYTDRCYRAFILDYFGDRSHPPNCGTCGNCFRAEAGDAKSGETPTGTSSLPRPAPSSAALDQFVMKHAPVALDLDDELNEQTRRRRVREAAEAVGAAILAATTDIAESRALSETEELCVRKILSCAARMQGRFGKNLLAATLRGSRSAKISQAGLDQLSTYGILRDMTQDELLLFIDALISAECLTVAAGAYPTVALTELGSDVMRGRASIQLALPPTARSYEAAAGGGAATGRRGAPSSASAVGSPPAAAAPMPVASKPSDGRQTSTVDETYALYQTGLSIEEISQRRGLTEITVEKHLADCILEGRSVDVSQYVSETERAQIELAIEQLGTERLKPLRDALPKHITYRMIRFVVADLQRAAQNSSLESI